MSLRSEVIRIMNEILGNSKKISELTSLPSNVQNTDQIEVVRSGVNYKALGSQLPSGGGGGSWGSITGTLSDQTDLNTALGARVLKAGDTMSGNLAMGSNKVTGLAAASANGEAVRYEQLVDALAGLKWKDSVRVATTVAGTLATSFENGDTVDGVVLATGNRILIKDQSSATENGIYTVNASGAPTRATDANAGSELEGATVTVQEGTSNANTTWTQTTDGVTIGSSNIVWAAFGSSSPDASETTKGIAELANQTETNTGTDDARIVTPLKLLVKNRKESTKTTGYTVAQTDDQGFLIANSASAIAFDFPSLEAGTIVTIININSGDVTWTNSGGTSFVGGLTSMPGGTLMAVTFRYRSTTVIEVLGGAPASVENFAITGVLSVKAGASAGTIAKVGGSIHTDTTTTGNVGTGEDTLFSYSLPANTLNTNKDSICGFVAGTFAANANNKNVRVKFGGTTLFATGAVAFNTGDWRIDFEIIRTGAATQKAIARFTSDNTSLDESCDYTTPAETLSGAITILVTGEATSNNDVVGEMFSIEFKPTP